MKILLDSNIVIAAAPLTGLDLEQCASSVIALLREIEEAGHSVFVHPMLLNDTSDDKDESRRTARQVLIRRYQLLSEPPGVPDAFRNKFGPPNMDFNETIDEALLAAVYLNSVDILISEDKGLLRKAARLGLERRVFSLDDSVQAFRALSHRRSAPLPAVQKMTCDQLSLDDPIFVSFKGDYPEFSDWFKKCKAEKRDAWIVCGEDQSYSAICIIKPERYHRRSPNRSVLKICSFKTSEIGRGLGELLIRTICDYAIFQNFDSAYIEVFPKYVGLINLLEQFGFSAVQKRTGRGEIILEKSFSCPPEEYKRLGALEFNIKYGPLKIKTEGVPIFIVPIRPNYHAMLFPDMERQRQLLPGRNGFGNTIRKAYLCHSKIRALPQGSILLFYRSLDERSVRCIGIVESFLRSADVKDVARFVGARTVYTENDIDHFCEKGTLAVLFRYAKPLSIPISLRELQEHQVIQGPPRSIVQVRSGGLDWIKRMIG